MTHMDAILDFGHSWYVCVCVFVCGWGVPWVESQGKLFELRLFNRLIIHRNDQLPRQPDSQYICVPSFHWLMALLEHLNQCDLTTSTMVLQRLNFDCFLSHTHSARKVKQGIDNVVQHHVTSTHSEARVHESRLIPVCLWGEQKE